jgi:hypothetical protein
MNSIAQIENSASRSRSTHEGESSTALCDRHSRTRDFSQRQLPTDQDYAVPTREYQTDQSSLKPAPTAAGPVVDKRQKQRQKQPHECAGIDRVTPYQNSIGIEAVLLSALKDGSSLRKKPFEREVLVDLEPVMNFRAGVEKFITGSKRRKCSSAKAGGMVSPRRGCGAPRGA